AAGSHGVPGGAESDQQRCGQSQRGRAGRYPAIQRGANAQWLRKRRWMREREIERSHQKGDRREMPRQPFGQAGTQRTWRRSRGENEGRLAVPERSSCLGEIDTARGG